MTVALSALIARLRAVDGQASIELAGSIWLLLAAALVAWELALGGWTATIAANAARTSARDYSRVADSGQALGDGYAALSGDGFTRSGSSIIIDGEETTVKVDLPLIVPWIHVPIPITAHATMPQTG
jgi:hypothetical protein